MSRRGKPVSAAQTSLFDGEAPYVRSSKTSKAAAKSLQKKPETLPTLRMMVLQLVKKAGDRGRTCDELEAITKMRHQTCSARFNELHNKDLILDSGTTRATRSGRQAVVWVAA